MRYARSFATAVIALSIAACAMMGGAPARTADGVLTNDAGMTLYTFDKDPAGAGKSVCNGPCATNWPPLLADADAKASGDYTIVKRDDGRMQWAHKGKPLNLRISGLQPGERTGDGFDDVRHVAKP
jgi:predicted lipoprotein with Yx(FWY)xxD motif